jgi:transcriptional regulator with XRE-family HTH domain
MNMETTTPQTSPHHLFWPKNMRFLRKQLDLSQEELAQRVGLNRGNIASYENGTAEPRVDYLIRFSEVFEVPLCDFTKRDLSEDRNFRAKVAAKAIASALPDNTCLDALMAEARNLQKMVQGLSDCSLIKISQLRDEAPHNYRLIFTNLEELSETARILSERYLFLLQHLNCKDQNDQTRI